MREGEEKKTGMEKCIEREQKNKGGREKQESGREGRRKKEGVRERGKEEVVKENKIDRGMH